MQFLADAKADPTVLHVFVLKRDRLGRPQDVLQILMLERDLILSGATLVTHDRVFTVIGERLLAKAGEEAVGDTAIEEHAALPHLRRRVEELDQDMVTANQRMAREKDDARYDALAKAFDEMRVERDAASRRGDELSARPNEAIADESPEQKVERLMAVLDE